MRTKLPSCPERPSSKTRWVILDDQGGSILDDHFHAYDQMNAVLLSTASEYIIDANDISGGLDKLDPALTNYDVKYAVLASDLAGFDLQLIPSLNDVSSIPTDRKTLFIISRVNNVLHFRIFDRDGSVVVNTDENRLLNLVKVEGRLDQKPTDKEIMKKQAIDRQGAFVKSLRKQLEPLWFRQDLSQAEKDEVIKNVVSIVNTAWSGRRFESRIVSASAKEVRRQVKQVEDDLLKIHGGWVQFGRKAPKNVKYLGKHNHTYAWVCEAGYNDLANLTLTVLNFSDLIKERSILTVPGGPRFTPTPAR